MNRFLSLQLIKKSNKLFPNLSIICHHRIVNFLSIIVSKSGQQLNLIQSFNNYQYIEAKTIFRSAFKNHIMDFNGFKNLVQEINFLNQYSNSQKNLRVDLLQAFYSVKGYQKNISSEKKKNIYVLKNQLSLKQWKNILNKQPDLKYLNKIVVVPQKNYPLSNAQQDFCIQNGLKIFPIKQWGLASLIKYLYQKDKYSMLINEYINQQNILYTNPENRYTAKQVIMLCFNKQNLKQEIPKQTLISKQKFIDFKIFAKNYIPRSVDNEFENKKSSFYIKRFIHLKQAQLIKDTLIQENQENSKWNSS